MEIKRETPDVGDDLLSYLRSVLDDAGLAYSSRPTPVEGGFDTLVYRFQLRGTRGELAKPLILRVFRGGSPSRAIQESAVQEAVAGTGYPAPRVHIACEDEGVLGSAFIIMDLMPGEPMMSLPLEEIPGMLAEAHLRLHAIDAEKITTALKARVGYRKRTLDRMFNFMTNQIRGRDLRSLYGGLEWIEANRPEDACEEVLCHGDFHPLNIIVEKGRVSGVLDWSGALIGDPAYDVGSTMFLAEVAAPMLQPGVDWKALAHRYLESYREASPLPLEKIEYNEAFRCLMSAMEGFQGHLAWQHPAMRQRMAEYFNEKTGVEISLAHM
jgi:aminoglycoside phosphotransferase (APT) family kinase protein